jgi:hypothetical protein
LTGGGWNHVRGGFVRADSVGCCSMLATMGWVSRIR